MLAAVVVLLRSLTLICSGHRAVALENLALRQQLSVFRDIVSERGDAAIKRVRELTGGLGAHSVLECVGHGESMRTAVGITRAGGAVGRVGVPQETSIPN